MIDYRYEFLGPTVNALVLVFGIVFSLAVLGLVIYLAGLPGRVARTRAHPQSEAISVLGWVGLPLGIAPWLIALIWALSQRADADATGVGYRHHLREISMHVDRLEELVSSMESRRPEPGR